MVAPASIEAGGGSRSMDSAEELGMVGIVAEGTAAVEIAEAGTATLDIVVAKAFAWTVVVRTGKAPCRREDTGSDNNPSHSRA